jgi:hypothetical protein
MLQFAIYMLVSLRFYVRHSHQGQFIEDTNLSLHSCTEIWINFSCILLNTRDNEYVQNDIYVPQPEGGVFYFVCQSDLRWNLPWWKHYTYLTRALCKTVVTRENAGLSSQVFLKFHSNSSFILTVLWIYYNWPFSLLKLWRRIDGQKEIAIVLYKKISHK